MAKKKDPTVVQLVDGVACVTITEAARRLNCSRQNVWTRIRRKTIPSILVGDRLYVPVEALNGAKAS